MEKTGVEMLYHSGPCLVLNKPPGILTQAPPGIDSVEVRLKAFLKHHENKTGNIYLGIPHRLDRPASGAMVFARHVRAARRLAEQFEARTVKKIYWVCVEGRVAPEADTWEDYVRKIPEQPLAEIVSADHPEGRLAILRYRTLGEGPWGTWLEIELETGRMHQVRVQAARRGHPVLGDWQYASTVPFGPSHEDRRRLAIALHARRLTFRHPMTHEPVDVEAPLPAAWQPLLLDR